MGTWYKRGSLGRPPQEEKRFSRLPRTAFQGNGGAAIGVQSDKCCAKMVLLSDAGLLSITDALPRRVIPPISKST